MAVNKLHFESSLDGTGFSRGVAGITGSLSSLKNTIAGVFGGFAIGQLVRGTIDWAGALQDSADALGVNVEFLQKLQNGAKLAGADIGDVTKFLMEINRSRQEALENIGGKKAAAFGRLGVSTAEISSLNLQAMMERIMGAFANGATTQSINDIRDVGGRSARELAAAFATQFASDVPILSAGMIAQLDDLGDSFTNLKTTLTVALAPAIIWVVEKLREFTNWLKQLGAFFGGVLGDIIENGFSGGASRSFTAGGQAAQAEAEAQAADAARIESARRAARDAAKARAAAGFSFPEITSTGVRKSAEAKLATDALLSVGNFLGAGGAGLINAIAEKQLREAEKTNRQIETSNDHLSKIERAVSRPSGGDLDIP